MDVSFHKEEDGVTHQLRDPPAYSVPNEQTMADGLKQRPFMSFTENYKAKLERIPQTPDQHVWFKANGDAPDSPLLNMALLAYQSDEALLGTARLPHRGSYAHENMQVASLDHSIWFHQPLSVGDWLLYSLDSPSSGNARGYTRGEIYTSEGVLVASCMQEGLMRML
jgi:acyl-CoA thioesterase-2